MHPFVFVCLRHISVYTHMPPYVASTHINDNTKHTLSLNKRTNIKCKRRRHIILIRDNNLGWGHKGMLNKAPMYYTKVELKCTKRNPNILYKVPTKAYKAKL